jgi:two-component system OmpR family sensor kinase
MKIRLFWKILLAFWLVLFLMSQGLWLLYAEQRGFVSSVERTAARVAPPLLTLLAERVRTDGPSEAQRELELLPERYRDQITIMPAPRDPPQPGELWETTHTAVAPDGREYHLRYVAPGQGRGPLEIPDTVLFVSAIAGLLFSLALARYLSRPLMLLRKGLGRVANGELDVRLQHQIRRGDEIADLARDFDVMTARLGQLLTARDRLLHDVSHELRSPLTRLQQAIDLARQDPARREELLDRIQLEASKLNAMVHELLALARAESGVHEANYFDPIAIAESVTSDAEFEAQTRGRHVRITIPPLDEDARPNVRGNAELVRRAIENVVRNAVRFSPSQSTVRIHIELLSAPLRYRIVITDEGKGVDGETLKRLFEPFVRGDSAGIGLGLAIAQRAILAHGGRIEARNRDNGGLVVEIELPAVPHVPAA